MADGQTSAVVTEDSFAPEAVLGRPADGCRVTAMGLAIDRDLTHGEWIAVGQKLVRFAGSLNWLIGDWLAYAEGRGRHGFSFDEAARMVEHSYEWCSQALRVSQAFPLRDRVRGLPWTTHRAALALPDAERVPLLRRAGRERWSRAKVLDEVQRRQAEIAKVAIAEPEAIPATVTLARVKRWREHRAKSLVMEQCPSCGHRWEKRVPSSTAGEGRG